MKPVVRLHIRKPRLIQTGIIGDGVSEKSNCVAASDSASDFRRKLFDERNMIEIKLVRQIEAIDREDMCVVFLRNNTISRQVEDSIPVSWRLFSEHTRLVRGESQFGSHC